MDPAALGRAVRLEPGAAGRPLAAADRGVWRHILPTQAANTGARIITDVKTVVWADGTDATGGRCENVNAQFGTNFINCVALKLDSNGIATIPTGIARYYVIQSGEKSELREILSSDERGRANLYQHQR